MTPRVCLVMIAKERPEVVRRALDSVRPLIDCWMVSTEPGDPLGADIAAMLADLPGEIVEYDRTSGGQARTLMMQHGERVAREHGAEYLLNLDADDEIAIDPAWRGWPALTEASYAIDHACGGLHYPFRRLFRVGLAWRWEGSLHEVPTCDATANDAGCVLIEGLTYVDHKEGRTPDRYAEHARILEADHARDPSNGRVLYYLAQSYRDAGDARRAYEAYSKRAAMGGFREEVYCSLMNCGALLQDAGQPWEKAQDCFLRAHAVAPHRAEPLFALAAYWLEVAHSPAVARMFAERAAALPRPVGGMLVHAAIYERHARELAAACAAAA